MCGILGTMRNDGAVEQTEFERMLATLSARGPDGSHSRILEGGRVALGHNRLSIIDLSDAAAEPMPNEDGTVWLTFNGEIYNFRALRERLQAAGHRFRSRSDSEVIIHAYEEWGDRCVDRLGGIFAFAIYDSRNRRLLLARDHLGVKPLYYRADADGIAFASQPRALLAQPGFTPRLDLEAFRYYLAYGYVPGEHCAFDTIRKLPAGCRYVYEAGAGRMERYWRLEYRPEILSEPEAVERVKETLGEVVRRQTVSDVPIGVFLSGGVDSSLVSAIVARSTDTPVKSFTIGFEQPEQDERPFARIAATAIGTVHHEKVLDVGDIPGMIINHLEIYDEPFYDTSGFSTYMVSRLAREQGVKVILSGDGGDELFAGYRRYDAYASRLAPAAAGASIGRRLLSMVRRPQIVDPVSAYFEQIGFFGGPAQEEILGPGVARPSWRHLRPLEESYPEGAQGVVGAQVMDLNTYLVDDILTKVDRASMACGLEVRVPLLDRDLVELAFRIGSDITYARNERKGLLKRAVADLLPAEILTTRKRGFSVPLKLWVSDAFRRTAKKLLLEGSLVSRGVLRPEGLGRVIEVGKRRQAWLLLSAELWARRWLEGRSPADLRSALLPDRSTAGLSATRAAGGP